MIMKDVAIPEVAFRVYPRKDAPKWLIGKKKLIERRWIDSKDGKKLLQKIAKECNLGFPNRIISDGIQVTISRYSSRKHGDSLGATSPTEPNKISLYVKKGDTYINVRSTLCHEMLHSLMWSKYYYDNRRKPVSFFADVFADELITTMFEKAIIRGRLKRDDFEWALDNACSETYARLKNLKRTNDYEELLGTLRAFFRECRKSIRRGSDVLKERERALHEILSPIPLTLEE